MFMPTTATTLKTRLTKLLTPVWSPAIAPVIEPLTAPVVAPSRRQREQEFDESEPRYRVLIHNDDITPFDYVIDTLQNIFMLSEELADHIAYTAHTEGQAIVVVRPRVEAEKLIMLAHTQARLAGYPLTFSLEPED
jgi:ATP-dependent Clp protease adaptor protein ClpS